ncbi:unnamed protein product [Enterobius vermicularis]|uniref:Astacin domain-containing protein n=1 Tax=Enterobius vermicularis TaxID=51028 RepID=A0A0N4VRJ7_ENTVE|nr:unnamed protein product [Enterobius vermicularis]
MHYHAVAHAVKVSDFTIVPKELKYVTTMGTERMAFLDAKVINDIYCPHICAGRHLNCQAGGYPDPNNCNVCRCPEGLGGYDCSQLQPSIFKVVGVEINERPGVFERTSLFHHNKHRCG